MRLKECYKDHSLFNEITGFCIAALIDWWLIVIHAIINAMPPEIRNIHSTRTTNDFRNVLAQMDLY